MQCGNKTGICMLYLQQVIADTGNPNAKYVVCEDSYERKRIYGLFRMGLLEEVTILLICIVKMEKVSTYMGNLNCTNYRID